MSLPFRGAKGSGGSYKIPKMYFPEKELPKEIPFLLKEYEKLGFWKGALAVALVWMALSMVMLMYIIKYEYFSH